jgi:hypothetical protein
MEQLGRLERKTYLLHFQVKPSSEDVFINVHNPAMIAKLLMCSNNLQIGMNGWSIFYTTDYQVKLQQNEDGLHSKKCQLCCAMQSN